MCVCVYFVYCSNDYTILLSMECCGDVFLFVHPCLSFKLLPLHLLNIFFLIFVFRANSRNDQQYIDVCVYAMHLRSGHIHMQLIHYASSIATEWLLWRFFVCSFFFFKNKTGGCRFDLFVCFAFFRCSLVLWIQVSISLFPSLKRSPCFYVRCVFYAYLFYCVFGWRPNAYSHINTYTAIITWSVVYYRSQFSLFTLVQIFFFLFFFFLLFCPLSLSHHYFIIFVTIQFFVVVVVKRKTSVCACNHLANSMWRARERALTCVKSTQ